MLALTAGDATIGGVTETAARAARRLEARVAALSIAPSQIPFVLRMISALGMDIGRDPGAAVSTDYVAPFAFEGTIKRITFDLPDRGPEAEKQAERAQIRADMARQ